MCQVRALFTAQSCDFSRLLTTRVAPRKSPDSNRKEKGTCTPSRPGPVFKIYPYTLKALLQAMEDARFQSFAGGPQEVVKTEGGQRTVIRRYEGGREAAP
jgi:hypothetical protein